MSKLGQGELWQALTDGARALPVPSRLELTLHGDALGIDLLECLRLQPGQRAVLRGDCRLGSVVVKLFVGAGAARRQRRELAGVRALRDARIPTPELYAHGRIASGYFLLFQALSAHAVDKHCAAPVVTSVMHLAGRMHAAGLLQTDMHLGNFLRVGTEVFAIDGDGVRQPATLTRSTALRNLAVLWVQFDPLRERREAPDWLAAYNAARFDAADASAVAPEELRAHSRRQRLRRLARYQKKTMRNCSEFVRVPVNGARLMCPRADFERNEAALLAFARDPEAAMGSGIPVKAGNTATVVRARHAGLPVVIKRYNVKSFTHRLLQTLRPRSRAQRAWQSALGLAFLGLPVARVYALLETRRGWFRDRGYLLMEDLGERDLASVAGDAAALEAYAPLLHELFAGLSYAGVVHGDTKATNFVVHDAQVKLIDLDGVQVGTRDKDRRRFVQNWAACPEMRTVAERIVRDSQV